VAIVLAAPDISTKEFREERAQKLSSFAVPVKVYCADDRALVKSKNINASDDRLGYCVSGVNYSRIPGIDVVQIEGSFQERWQHSYYLYASEVWDDMLSYVRNPRDFPPGGSWKNVELRSR
jgi:esterase/lipase superfamily enzyme